MEIISVYRVTNDDDYKSMYANYEVFFRPSSGGNHVAEASITMAIQDMEDYDVPIFNSYREAYKHAFLQCFPEEDWLYNY